jgi:hypothetical protein
MSNLEAVSMMNPTGIPDNVPVRDLKMDYERFAQLLL